MVGKDNCFFIPKDLGEFDLHFISLSFFSSVRSPFQQLLLSSEALNPRGLYGLVAWSLGHDTKKALRAKIVGDGL